MISMTIIYIGFRSCGITVLIALGLSVAVVKGISSHSTNSQILHRYIRLQLEHFAKIIVNFKCPS